MKELEFMAEGIHELQEKMNTMQIVMVAKEVGVASLQESTKYFEARVVELEKELEDLHLSKDFEVDTWQQETNKLQREL